MNGEFWFVDQENTERGPVGNDEIVKMIKEGSIKRESPIWSNGMQDWATAGQVGEFSSLFDPARPPARKLTNEDRPRDSVTSRAKRAVCAVLIFGASFLPFGDSNGFPIIVVYRVAEFMNYAVHQLASSTNSRNAGASVGDAALAFDLLLALYAIPASSIIVVFAALVTRRSRFWALVNGLSSTVLLVFIPLLASAILRSSLPKELAAVFFKTDYGFSLDFSGFGMGFWAIMILGIFQLAFSFQRG